MFHYLSNRFQGDNPLSIVCRILLLTVLFILNRFWLRTTSWQNQKQVRNLLLPKVPIFSGEPTAGLPGSGETQDFFFR